MIFQKVIANIFITIPKIEKQKNQKSKNISTVNVLSSFHKHSTRHHLRQKRQEKCADNITEVKFLHRDSGIDAELRHKRAKC